jgi:8-oxo-dGTP diphosphatase
MNEFESGKRKVVPACLIYARAKGYTLMLHRNAGRDGDIHDGKWNGLGGKMEPGEGPIEAAQREFHEEADVDLPLSAFTPLGVLHFPNFKASQEQDWVVYVFAAEYPVADVQVGKLRQTREGDLHWVKDTDVIHLNLWEGDREFLPYVMEAKPFIGCYWYEQGALARSWIHGL